MKIVHIITSLKDGGAENSLYKICKYDNLNKHIVISLTSGGKYFALLKKLKIEVYCLNLKNYLLFYKIFDLTKLLIFLKPELVQTWLVHGDFIGSIASKLAGVKKIVWNIRYSNLEIGKTKITTILLTKILEKFSFSVPNLIIFNSENAKKIYEKKGFSKKNTFLIHNGYDLTILKPNIRERYYFRKKIKINRKVSLIGNVARYDVMKDHKNLLYALSIVKKNNINFFCILVGTNINRNNSNLVYLIKKLKLSKNVKLLGSSSNIPEIMNGIDVHILSSRYGEGFPNVVAEAMACKTPCIVTKVGDSSLIVGKTGWVAPIKSPTKLAKIIQKALSEIGTENWKKRCDYSRMRIEKKFNIRKMLTSYNKAWHNTLDENNQKY
tara:strand:- start:4697 stop:5839 length:1143 start_codon:yes stop_codon:yes gene_type:complete